MSKYPISSYQEYIKRILKPGIVAHTYSPDTWKAKTGESFEHRNSRPSWIARPYLKSPCPVRTQSK
jgi:hypothetical protein